MRIALTLAAIAALVFCGFLGEAPNRLVSGAPLALWQVAPLAHEAVAIVLAFALLFLPRRQAMLALVVAGAGSILLLLEAGYVAQLLMAAAKPAARISLELGFWIAFLCLALVILDAVQRTGRALAVVAVLAVLLAAVFWSGALDQLSVMREFAARRAEFSAELARHLVLVLAAVAGSLAIGVPLGIWAARVPARAGAIFGTLNLLQTIPSVALFGILIAPLAALGVGGIGPAPAIVALVLYSLLPVARNVEAGLAGIDQSVLESARAMGLSEPQIAWRVELPLGMPVFLAGLRIVFVQAVGLAAVAALIGAGGLGTFIFEGIGEYATDLVLLGTIPTVLLALAGDFLIATAARLLSVETRA